MGDPAEKYEKLPAEYRADMLAEQTNPFFNVALFEQYQRVAQMLYQAKMWPDHLRTVGDALITLNFADRIKSDPVMVAQMIYIVHGKPGIEGKLTAALINQSGKYSEPLQYEWLDGENNVIDDFQVYSNPEKDERGCRAYSIDTKSGTTVKGAKVTWKVVHEEGWFNKSGSKWKTIPELMFMYRAASWFANINCPDVKLGMHTVEELRDMDAVPMIKTPNGGYAQAGVSSEKPEDLYKPSIDPEDQYKAHKEKELSDIDWDPLKEPIQQKYGSKKAQIIKTECRKRGMQADDLLPRLAHEMLLEDEKKKSEGEAKKTEIVDSEPNDEPADTEISEEDQEDQQAVVLGHLKEAIAHEKEADPARVTMGFINARVEEDSEDPDELQSVLNEIIRLKEGKPSVV